MNIHIQNIGDCQKCGLTLTSFFSSSNILKDYTFTDNPKNTDILIIVGCLSKTQLNPLLSYWKKMPVNHRIMSIGDCGTSSQDLFKVAKNEMSLKNLAIAQDDLSEILPIDYVVEGCPPTLHELDKVFNSIL